MICKIITIVDPRPNYGNQLQNYAVQKVIEELSGERPQTIVFEKRWDTTWKGHLRYCINRFTRFKLTNSPSYWQYDFWRAKAFYAFRDRYITSVEVDDTPDPDSADFFILGSDQVWNPNWFYQHKLKKNMFLLSFAPSEKRVCFSPSFGISDFPDEWKKEFAEQLNKFPYLGVREKEGAKIIQELTGRKSTVMIDPTLLLDSSEWKKISKKPKHVSTDCSYVLVYVLGDITKEIRRDVERLEKEYGMKIFWLMQKRDTKLYISDPANFLYLVEHAKLILTDSFHACVFSFLFSRPFLVYYREGNETEEKLMSRIYTLLGMLKLDHKLVKKTQTYSLEEMLEADYSAGYKILKEKRKETIEFLKQSMGLE